PPFDPAAGASASGSDLASPPPSSGAAPVVSSSASGVPTWTTSSTSALILVTVPLVGAGTSASTLSVETSTTVCPSSTKSPSATCHSSTVPSVTDSPISGITTCTVDVVAIARSYSRTSTSSNTREVAPEALD